MPVHKLLKCAISVPNLYLGLIRHAIGFGPIARYATASPRRCVAPACRHQPLCVATVAMLFSGTQARAPPAKQKECNCRPCNTHARHRGGSWHASGGSTAGQQQRDAHGSMVLTLLTSSTRNGYKIQVYRRHQKCKGIS
jgi:hypothetical protein